jgi:hypothetical protein
VNVEPDEQTLLPEFPLAVLHPDSFLTLTCLHLNVMITRDWENTPLADPYLALCEKALRNLIVLQELKVNICIADIIALPDTAYGPQWGKLDRALASDETTVCLLPHLRVVGLDVLLKVWDGNFHSGGSIRSAEDTLGNIRTHIPPHFSALISLTRKGKLNFSFDAGLQLVPYHTPGRSHQTDQWKRHHNQ